MEKRTLDILQNIVFVYLFVGYSCKTVEHVMGLISSELMNFAFQLFGGKRTL